MQTIILLLTLALLFSVLYNRIQIKDYNLLRDAYLDLKKENTELFNELNLQKSLAKTFEAGYDNAKQQQVIN